jgi:Cu-Zn family superoxide dismutase
VTVALLQCSYGQERIMNHRTIVLVGVVLVLGASARAQTPKGTTGDPLPPGASATLIDGEGRSVGEARLQQTPHGVIVKLDLRNATPGVHALHIHDIGRCDTPSFTSAGAHFSPAPHKHGFMNPAGPHAGDLPNIYVPQTTQELSVEFLAADVTIAPGPRSLLDANGSALVLHASKDDYATDPSGNAGDRIACGRIEKSQ